MMATQKQYSNTTFMVLCGLFAALTAICSFISIPLPFTPIPMNLGTLAVFLAGGILGKKYGTISIIVYVLLGAVGVPVFAGFRGGIGVLAGPTGGYIFGYIAAAFIIGLILDKALSKTTAMTTAGAAPLNSKNNSTYHKKVTREIIVCIIAMILGLIACYALGTAWFMYSTRTALWPSLIACVFPFLIGDAIKILAASILVRKLRPTLR